MIDKPENHNEVVWIDQETMRKDRHERDMDLTTYGLLVSLAMIAAQGLPEDEIWFDEAKPEIDALLDLDSFQAADARSLKRGLKILTEYGYIERPKPGILRIAVPWIHYDDPGNSDTRS